MAASTRPPKPNGGGWLPYGPDGWFNPSTGSFVLPDGHGGFQQVSHGQGAPRPYSPKAAGNINRSAGFKPSKTLDDPGKIRGTQDFLRNHGYRIPTSENGMLGEVTKAAIQDWHSSTPGFRSQAAQNFNTKHGLVPRAAPHGSTPLSGSGPGGASRTAPQDKPAPSSGGDVAGDPVGALVATLLKQAGVVGKLIPESGANDAAAPFTAAAAEDQRQIDQNPDAKLQALADIGNWYKQVKSSLGTAKTRDQAITDAGAQSVDDATARIVGSLGGSAMGGAGVVSSIGENGADTIRAMGTAQGQLANDLAPIFDLAATGAKTSTASKFDTDLAALKTQLAKDQGNAAAAKAQALAGIISANNGVVQTDFSNQAGLLNTLAALQVNGQKATSSALLNALRAKKLATPNPNTFAGSSAKEKAAVTQAITAALVDPNSGQLKGGMDWPKALSVARNIVRSNGWAALNPSVVNQVIKPALSIAGITFNNPATLYQP